MVVTIGINETLNDAMHDKRLFASRESEYLTKDN